MYCRHRFTVSERDIYSSPLLPRLEAQAGVQVEDTEQTPAQNALSPTLNIIYKYIYIFFLLISIVF